MTALICAADDRSISLGYRPTPPDDRAWIYAVAVVATALALWMATLKQPPTWRWNFFAWPIVHLAQARAHGPQRSVPAMLAIGALTLGWLVVLASFSYCGDLPATVRNGDYVTGFG